MAEGSILVNDNNLLGIIADEDMCVGFLIAGIGEERKDELNFFVVERDTTDEQIITFLRNLMKRLDIAIILIATDVAARIKSVINSFQKSVIIPTIVEVPAKGHLYNMDTDDQAILATKFGYDDRDRN